MNKVCTESSQRKRERCLFGFLHLNSAMRLLVTVGVMVILAILIVLYFKFRKSMFVLMIPTSVIVFTVFAIVSKYDNFLWPIIGISMFHVVLSSYAMLIFAFFFVFKPHYIIMVLNWAFKTLHTDKTLSYYLQCGGIALFLIVFTTFNVWQAMVSYSYKTMLRNQEQPKQQQQPTLLVVNKPGLY